MALSAAELEQCFDACDLDHSGEIVSTELRSVLDEVCKGSSFKKEDIQACCDVSLHLSSQIYLKYRKNLAKIIAKVTKLDFY